MVEKLPHLILEHRAITKPYTAPSAGGGSNFRLQPRDRIRHGTDLLNALLQVQDQETHLVEQQRAMGRDTGTGLYLNFESDPGFELAFESLDVVRSGIELICLKEIEGRMQATVFVPEGKISYFIRRIESYLDASQDRENQRGERQPKNRKLIDSISKIRLAALEALWTDDPALFPLDDTPLWWEVWFRVGSDFDEVGFFRRHAEQMDIHIADEEIRFLERCIVLMQATRSQMANSLRLLGGIAELRLAKQHAGFYTAMRPAEQHAEVGAAAQQLTAPDPQAPTICLLDTGVNEGHPLLKLYLDSQDKHACHSEWGTHDHHPFGHGTAMAGMALHGDLSVSLSAQPFPAPEHRLESAKVLPPDGHNPPHLYGSLYRRAIHQVTDSAPHRLRVFCSAITATDARDRGRPTSWSAQIDMLASGLEDGKPRLIFQAAGNADHARIKNYPASNDLDPIHDPGQAWNALTVGASTEKWQIDTHSYPGRQLIARPGGLAPTSCTTTAWPTTGRQKWPNKPDIVMEGGNWALDPALNFAEDLDSLQLLATGHEHFAKPLVTFGETSAATALAARLAAKLQVRYPELWPETLRALVVHAAQWTPAMLAAAGDLNIKSNVRKLMRRCGYGVPQPDVALWSAKHALTLVAQNEITPYQRTENGDIGTRDIQYHAWPWPVEALRALPLGTPVEMRVTLSYFIQPNPGERGWSGRFSYASHGLRFRVKAPDESPEEFEARINQAARDVEYERTGVSDNTFWVIGSDTRELGSLHSDIWRGTASQLADCGYLAVYPVTGWWRTRKALDRWHGKVRYALVVSIRTPEESVDIYTPVKNQIAVATQIDLS